MQNPQTTQTPRARMSGRTGWPLPGAVRAAARTRGAKPRSQAPHPCAAALPLPGRIGAQER